MNEAALPSVLAFNSHTNSVPGLVWAYSARPGQPATPLEASSIAPALARREGWVWLHVDLLDHRVPHWIADLCDLPASVHAILEGHDASLVLAHENGVVHGVAADLHGELARPSTTIGRLHFAVTDFLLITGSYHNLASVKQIHEQLVSGHTFETAFEAFEAIMLSFCRATGARLSAASKQIDEVEDHLVTSGMRDERLRLKEARRLAVALHRPIAAMVSLFQDEEHDDWLLSAKAHRILQHLTLRLERLDREVVMVRDRARLLQEEVAAELADESNRSLKSLAIISALLLPGTLVVGIFGMNTGGLPLSESPDGFVSVLFLAILATALFYWLMRKAGANFKL